MRHEGEDGLLEDVARDAYNLIIVDPPARRFTLANGDIIRAVEGTPA
jgi:hypothetical protein